MTVDEVATKTNRPVDIVSTKSYLEANFGYSRNFLPHNSISPVCCASSNTRSIGLERAVGLCVPAP